MSVTNIKRSFTSMMSMLCWHYKPVIPVKKLNHPYVLSDWLNAIIIERESLDPLVLVIFLFISSGLNSDVKLQMDIKMLKCSWRSIIYKLYGIFCNFPWHAPNETVLGVHLSIQKWLLYRQPRSLKGVFVFSKNSSYEIDDSRSLIVDFNGLRPKFRSWMLFGNPS